MSEPYIKLDDGDYVSGKVFNELQIKIRNIIDSHFHNGGLDQGKKIKEGSIDEKIPLKVRNLEVSGSGKPVLVTKDGAVGIGTENPITDLDVKGTIRCDSFESTSEMVHRMYPSNPVIYQNIFEALEKRAIKKLGDASYDDHTHRNKLWKDREVIKFGGNKDTDGNGAEVTIPDGYDTLWVRVLGDRWNVINAYFTDGKKEPIGKWTGGHRRGNCYCPDGSLTDSFHDFHQWVPIPCGRSGKVALISKKKTDRNMWFSGLAFSKNPWGHAAQSAVGYHWAINGGTKTYWKEGWHDWNADSLTRINEKTINEMMVPFVYTGKDKLLYFIEHNDKWNGCMHTSITVNGTKIDRFISTYDNPFSRHWNTKSFNRYIAARIPVKLLPKKSGFLSVKMDMKKQNGNIYIREAGTHDFYL